MNKRIGPILLLAVTLAGTVGCQGIQRPQAEVRSVAVTEQTDEGARIEVVVRLRNPNDVVLPVWSAAYDVTVEQVGVFSFTDQPPVTLPPEGEQTLTLPAAFVRGDEPLAGKPVSVTGRLHYQPPGEVRALMTEYGIPLPSVGFGQRGTLSDAVAE